MLSMTDKEGLMSVATPVPRVDPGVQKTLYGHVRHIEEDVDKLFISCRRTMSGL